MKAVKTFLMVIVVLAIVACNKSGGTTQGSSGSGKDAVQVWKVSTMGNDQHQVTMTLRDFAEEVKKRTNGAIDIQVFPNGQLGTSPDQVLGGIQNGIIEMGEIATTNCTEYTKTFVPIDTPYTFLSRDQAVKFITDENNIKIFRDKVRADVGLYLVAFLDFGFRDVTNSRRPIRTPADLRGLKIRTLSNPIQMKAFEALGALPTPMAFSEVYTALQQKLVDAEENPPDTIFLQKFHEVNKYISLTDHQYSFDAFFMNANKYDSLSEEHKKAITDAWLAVQQKSYDRCYQGIQDAISQLKEAGAEINELTPQEKAQFQAAVKPAWDLAAQTCGQEYFDQIQQLISSAN
jgi:tripartite ATP-independent transporter DctP family solute receptor